ncbi:PEP-CTERM sorting domain-containing protein [Luteolibacter flavescens]|uniref:PEP-CTERM sorting domain-containing protein n=1 Tax=Luteolibacter flavescens TaxID=1859460 RepID=A0ABT3FLB0_9BACT|nr:PEP-CTERM sorting domain-containing protein [Luteolibacter flavescens]MCW1884356.1 PEP-CTERM sorting domain-containing protein [Luteolibacter flavescens]
MTGATAQAAVLLGSFNLGGTQQVTTTWNDLSGANFSLTPTSGDGTIAHSNTAFQGSFGFYSLAANGYSVTGTQSASFDIESVLWQIEASPNPDLAWPYNDGPTLTVMTSAGSQILQPVAFSSGFSEGRYNYGAEPITYTAFAWQWNLSSIDDTITSITLNAPISIHTSVSASQIDVANAFTQVIPEPSSLLLAFAAVPFFARRRRASV